MFIAKIVSVVVAGILTGITARLLLAESNKAKARVHAKARKPATVTKLRQDPATGVYYPVE